MEKYENKSYPTTVKASNTKGLNGMRVQKCTTNKG